MASIKLDAVDSAACTTTSKPSRRAVRDVTGPIDAAFTSLGAMTRCSPIKRAKLMTVDELVKLTRAGGGLRAASSAPGASTGSTNGAASGNGKAKDEGVIDAEYEDVEEKK